MCVLRAYSSFIVSQESDAPSSGHTGPVLAAFPSCHSNMTHLLKDHVAVILAYQGHFQFADYLNRLWKGC